MKHGTSGVVAIPPDYRRYHNLSHGKTVKILYDSLLLIVPKELEKRVLGDPEKKALIDKLLG
jgi:antitoxin component of MazEF toxin-antitoxin module